MRSPAFFVPILLVVAGASTVIAAPVPKPSRNGDSSSSSSRSSSRSSSPEPGPRTHGSERHAAPKKAEVHPRVVELMRNRPPSPEIMEVPHETHAPRPHSPPSPPSSPDSFYWPLDGSFGTPSPPHHYQPGCLEQCFQSLMFTPTPVPSGRSRRHAFFG